MGSTAARAMRTPRPPQQTVDGTEVVRAYVTDLHEALTTVDVPSVGRIVELIAAALADGRSVYIAGNGGSAAAAAHMAVDWAGAAIACGSRACVTNLAESAMRLTALGNDIGFEDIFAHQIDARADQDDVLVLLSVSGSSPNLVRAAESASRLGMTVVGLFGHAGSVAEHCSQWAVIGMTDYGLTEDLHVSINHMVVRALRGGCAHRYHPAETRGR